VIISTQHSQRISSLEPVFLREERSTKNNMQAAGKSVKSMFVPAARSINEYDLKVIFFYN